MSFLAKESTLVKLTMFVHRKPSLSIDDFERYWRYEHPKALAAYNDKLGRPMVRYVQCHRNPPDAKRAQAKMSDVFGKTNLDDEYEAVVEIWFTSVEKMVETYRHPLYQELVSPDEAKFGAGPMKYIVVKEVLQWDYT